MKKSALEYIKEAAPTMLCILGAVWLFGKVVESNVDVDRNWQDYIDSKKERRN